MGNKTNQIFNLYLEEQKREKNNIIILEASLYLIRFRIKMSLNFNLK